MRRFGIAAYRLGGILGFGLATLLFYWSLRIAWADWISKDRTRSSILAAIQLFPENSLFYRFWAEIEPRDAVVALRQGAVVNPMNPAIRIELGMAAEKAGNLTEAEASFVTAVALERTFAPRRVLADYYFRHRESDKFWPAVRDALEHTYGDTTVLFEDCWILNPDAPLILQRAIPDQPQVLTNYLEFLVSHDHLEAAGPVADRVMAKGSTESGTVLLDYCDRLIADNSASRAVAIWNWLSQRKFLPYETLDPAKGRSLTNGSFSLIPTSRAFDWRLSPVDGIYIERAKLNPGLDLTFTGKQPEKCDIASQFIPLQPNRAYRLRVAYSTTDIDRESGLSWRVLIPNTPDLLLGTLPGATGEKEFIGHFVTPPDNQLARLVLGYERVKGTVRIEGSVEIRKVELSYAK